MSTTSYTYSGKYKKPTIKVTDSKGKTISSSYYTVSYKNNKYVGTAKVTITFKDRYSGKVTKTYTIAPKGTKISALTAGKKSFVVKWQVQKSQTTGYQIEYSTDKNFKNSKIVTVAGNSSSSKTITGLKAKQKYYVRIRTFKQQKVDGKTKTTYSEWSSVKNVKTK